MGDRFYVFTLLTSFLYNSTINDTSFGSLDIQLKDSGIKLGLARSGGRLYPLDPMSNNYNNCSKVDLSEFNVANV